MSTHQFKPFFLCLTMIPLIFLSGCETKYSEETVRELMMEIYDLEDQISDLESTVSDQERCIDEYSYAVDSAISEMESGYIEDAYYSIYGINRSCD